VSQAGLSGFKLAPPAPKLFGRFAAAGADQTISTPTARAAAARVQQSAEQRRTRARRGVDVIWDSIEFARGHENPWEELPFLGCWLHDHGAYAGEEADYYCESYLEGSGDQPKWTDDRVAWWLGTLSKDQAYFRTIPPPDLADAVALAWRTQEDEGTGIGTMPEALARRLAAEALDPGILEGGVRLVNLPADDACKFIEKHHSALPYCNRRGLMFALGAVVPNADGEPMLVAVATAGSPTGAWTSRGCSQHGTLELTRVAAIGGLKTRDRKGRVRPLAASSKLTSRMIDLLPESGREGETGCRFVTYSLDTEQGTTYLALAAKGLRPVAFNKGKPPTGARAKAGPRSLGHVNKIVWEAGPAARPPNWALVPRAQRQGAELAFQQYLRHARA
jgi:hypothetical protein